MRVFLILVVCLFSLAAGQEGVPDTSDTTYVPLDSLDAGLDLALDALKMKRGDLTFRGDYLEPDAYRIPWIDVVMNEPFMLPDYAQDKIDGRRGGLLEFDMHYECALNIPPFKTLKRSRYGLEETMSDSSMAKWKVILGERGAHVLASIFRFIWLSDWYNSVEYDTYTSAQIDSLAEGFTILLEENVGDETLSAEQLDSLSEFEDNWTTRLTSMAKQCIGREGLGGFFVIDPFFAMRMIHNYSVYLGTDGDSFEEEFGITLLDGPKFSSTYYENTNLGQIIIGDTTDNHYTGDLFIVIDPGGDDTYDIEFEGTGHHTYIIDYDGNDVYNMPKNRISPYFFGSNMIIDYDGDDSYNAGSWTLGAGLFGVGMLWDMKGNDRYFGDTFTQGAGCFGVGILRDDEGNDTYQAALYSQGFGFVEGIGVLMDNSGNDNYFAGGKYKDFIRYNDHYLSLSQGFAYGIRPKMSGGVGMLIDKSGNDVYVSDIFGQGASYWYGLGMLADGGGNDQYISFQYAQGNGTHMSLGILYDVSGDDVYSAKGVSQGCGHDRAAGMLIDLDGDDNYNAYDLCQGAGSANGLGIIADVRGKDVYIVRSDRNTQGYGNPRREYGSIGIFLDLSGQDGYSGGLGRDNHWWTHSKWGVGIDK
jgi:hypothetical protein